MPEDPARKIAIVTGGMSGIGAAVADRLAADGLTVVAADLSAETTALQPGNGIHPYQMDVNDAAAVDDLISAVTGSYGQLDCVVHCAGIGRVAPFLDTTLELFDLVVRTNLYGTFLVGQASARAMVSTGGGVIVNIGSVSGLRGNAGRAAYGASKGAVITLSQVMAVELAQHGVRVNVVAPGPIETPLAASAHSAAVRDAWAASVPMQRYGRPQDVASAAAYLCSDDAGYITGSVLVVDGGFVAGGILNDR
jgi:NAD(P)-dependent dehydrogenase (short-subunit alcohol dehydrogenase family)